MAGFANFNGTQFRQNDLPTATDFLGFATAFRGLRLLAQNLAERRAERRERLVMARELDTYSDRELGELGFSRADLPAIVAGTYRR
ncbi:hypothetical protein [Acidisoma sp. C75]